MAATGEAGTAASRWLDVAAKNTSISFFGLPAFLRPPRDGCGAARSANGGFKAWFCTLASLFFLTAGGVSVAGETNSSRPAPPEASPKSAPPAPTAAAQAPVADAYGKLPLRFEANEGQADRRVRFLARGNGQALFLTPREAVLALASRDAPRAEQAVVRMRLIGANRRPQVTGEEKLPTVSNYYIGNDRSKWRSGIANYARVAYHDVYPGIDQIYYGNPQQLEYDFVVAPGADPQAIVQEFKGIDGLELDANGELILRVAGGAIRQSKPHIYQRIGGEEITVAGGYRLLGKKRIGYEIVAYDKSAALIIDPVLVYSTYLGGSSDEYAKGIAVDSSGSAIVTGYTFSLNFPTASAFIPSKIGGYDVFVSKLTPDGTALVYSTYLGCPADEFGTGIAVDAVGNAYVTGYTNSNNCPTTPMTVLQPLYGGGTSDAFVVKFGPNGSMVYATYLGGNGADVAYSIAVDSAGKAYVTGYTDSTNLATENAIQLTLAGGLDAFVAVLDSTAETLRYSTYLGGAGNDFGRGIAVDVIGRIYVTGRTDSLNFPTTLNALQPSHGSCVGCDPSGFADAFITQFYPVGGFSEFGLINSTYLGGQRFDEGTAIAVEPGLFPEGGPHVVYVTGTTASSNFPTTLNAFDTSYNLGADAFVVKYDSFYAGALLYSSYLGGSDHEEGLGIAVDGLSNIYITGHTSSANFPTVNSLQAFAGPTGPFQGDVFVSRISNDLVLGYSTFLGGSGVEFGNGIAVDGSGNAYVSGHTTSTNFPVVGAPQTGNAGGVDAFVAKLSPDNAPPPPPPDADSDGVPDATDNCPAVPNPDQLNSGGSALGDACEDQDGDTVLDVADNCPAVPNAGQADFNGDGIGDVCADSDFDGWLDSVDACPLDGENDIDVDDRCANVDNCPAIANPDQADSDGNGVGNACDPAYAGGAPKNTCTTNCTTDSDGDGLADNIDPYPTNPDYDGDGDKDGADNCIAIANADQQNTDGDIAGDACDSDDDNDTILDATDNCPLTANASQSNIDGDATGDACDADADGDSLSSTAEAALGTSPTNPDTDGDGLRDDVDPNPLLPAGSYAIVFKVLQGVTDVTSTWLPVPGGSATVVAALRDPNGNPVNFSGNVTFTLSSTAYAGKATNDTEVCVNAICAPDYSLATTPGTTTQTVAPGVDARVVLYAFDYGGEATLTVTTTAGGNTVTGIFKGPRDTDGDSLPDAFELLYQAQGFNPANAHSFDAQKLDGDIDRDPSLGSQALGDGLSAFKEYRGILFQANNCSGVAGAHMRLSPVNKDLFVRGVNFANSCPASTALDVLPFSVAANNGISPATGQSAFAEVGIHLHDVTGMLSFSGATEPPNLDILVVTNNLTDTSTLVGAATPFINQKGFRNWEWDVKGASYIGTTMDYAKFVDAGGVTRRGTFTYHQNLMHYVFNRPYLDETTNPLNPSYVGLLDPSSRVEDYRLENGVGPETSQGKTEDFLRNNGLLDGDRIGANWPNVSLGAGLYRAGHKFSIFDADGDGRVELPVVADALLANLNPATRDAGEYLPDELQIHTVLHEMGHAAGITDHTADSTCLMYSPSISWTRAGHFGNTARSQLYIHNKTEF